MKLEIADMSESRNYLNCHTFPMDYVVAVYIMEDTDNT